MANNYYCLFYEILAEEYNKFINSNSINKIRLHKGDNGFNSNTSTKYKEYTLEELELYLKDYIDKHITLDVKYNNNYLEIIINNKNRIEHIKFLLLPKEINDKDNKIKNIIANILDYYNNTYNRKQSNRYKKYTFIIENILDNEDTIKIEDIEELEELRWYYLNNREIIFEEEYRRSTKAKKLIIGTGITSLILIPSLNTFLHDSSIPIKLSYATSVSCISGIAVNHIINKIIKSKTDNRINNYINSNKPKNINREETYINYIKRSIEEIKDSNYTDKEETINDLVELIEEFLEYKRNKKFNNLTEEDMIDFYYTFSTVKINAKTEQEIEQQKEIDKNRIEEIVKELK